MNDDSSKTEAPLIVRAIRTLNHCLGVVAAWLMLPVVLISFLVVILRYGFGIGFIWMQELFIWTHGIAFLSAAAYAFQQGVHVRVDVFYSRMGPRARARVNIIGTVFLLFVMSGVLFYVASPQVIVSWTLGERSSSLAGLSYAYVLKSFVLVFCVSTILHGVVLIWESWTILATPEKGEVK